MLEAEKIDILLTARGVNGEENVRPIRINTSDNHCIGHAVAAALVVEALGGNVRAAQEIYDRVEGKPLQTVKGNLFEGAKIVIDDEDDNVDEEIEIIQ